MCRASYRAGLVSGLKTTAAMRKAAEGAQGGGVGADVEAKEVLPFDGKKAKVDEMFDDDFEPDSGWGIDGTGREVGKGGGGENDAKTIGRVTAETMIIHSKKVGEGVLQRKVGRSCPRRAGENLVLMLVSPLAGHQARKRQIVPSMGTRMCEECLCRWRTGFCANRRGQEGNQDKEKEEDEETRAMILSMFSRERLFCGVVASKRKWLNC